MTRHLYLHFPFCRTKCSYCALYSRAGSTLSQREVYIRQLTEDIRKYAGEQFNPQALDSIYCGGGSPAMCELKPLFKLLHAAEFTVELHPLDVTKDTLLKLRDGGVNRISMGVQSLDDSTLAAMNRGYSFAQAARTFDLVKKYFDNVGIDLIVGYPGDRYSLSQQFSAEATKRWESLKNWGLQHCSVYSLQNERQLEAVPDDEAVLDGIRAWSEFLATLGLQRYEISNYALPGRECQHNLNVWRGGDYLGLGEGAYGRIGLTRTLNGKVRETVTPEEDLKERTLFQLRTREGLNIACFPQWHETLERFVNERLLIRRYTSTYVLTPRGTEVVDSILVELV